MKASVRRPPSEKGRAAVDVQAVIWGVLLAGPVCTAVGVRLRVRARRDREYRQLVADLAAVLPAGGRLVYRADPDIRVTVVAPGRDV